MEVLLREKGVNPANGYATREKIDRSADASEALPGLLFLKIVKTENQAVTAGTRFKQGTANVNSPCLRFNLSWFD